MATPSTTVSLRAYTREIELLVARRVSTAVGLIIMFTAMFGILEYRFHPQRQWNLLGLLALDITAASFLLSTRVRLMRRRKLSLATALTVGGSCVGLVIYSGRVGGDTMVLATLLVCILTATSIILPWRVAGQTLAATAAVIAFAIHVYVNPSPTTSALYPLFALGSGALVSMFGAQYLDLQRLAIFRESVARDDAAVVSRSLLRIAGDLNSTLEAETVINQLVQRVRESLSCDFGVLLLWDDHRHTFRIVAGTSERREMVEEAKGLEFQPSNYETLNRIMAEHGIAEISPSQPIDDAVVATIRHFGIQRMLLASMSRAERVVGLMVAGRLRSAEPFTSRDQSLVLGMSQQAAVAIENAQLVTNLRRADRLKSEFVSTMSHELRTPLNIILGYADLLAEEAFGEISAEQQDTVQRIHHQAHDLLSLINATLDVNRLEAGTMPLETEDFRISDFIAELRLQTDLLARAEAVTLSWRVHSDGILRSDPRKLKIILRNLISNALKFTDAGAVTIDVRCQPGQSAEFVVCDTGIGIPESELTNVFEMFQQVRVPTRAVSGVGLGLYIVRRFVDLLNGTVALTSKEGAGTTFRLTIPELQGERYQATSNATHSSPVGV